MLTTRRLAAALCALCLIIPAAASARVADADHPAPTAKSTVAYGDTKYDLQNQQDLKGVTGDTKGDLKAPAPTAAVAPASTSASDDDGTNEWRIAAIVEAALLAAFAAGAALALSGRGRRRSAGLGV
jgi:anti-sigma-K factor RskA